MIRRSLADADLSYLEVIYLLRLALQKTVPFSPDRREMVLVLGAESGL